MQNDILFTEKQRFTQWWIWLVLLGIGGLFLYAIYYQVIGGEPFGDKPMSDNGLLLTFGFTLLFILLFVSFRLDTLIKIDGIYVRFFPFQLKYRFYAWDTIAKAYIYHSQPIAEFGGWGMRFSMSGKGRALTVSGEMGLQLEFTNGSALLIGTQKPKEIERVLAKLGRTGESR
ncbi:MAG: hypothetical protein HUU34_13305 [Saprospiraceae bacterium]|nr:hypothetical protein [Saprospiraceae bacterium]